MFTNFVQHLIFVTTLRYECLMMNCLSQELKKDRRGPQAKDSSTSVKQIQVPEKKPIIKIKFPKKQLTR